MELAEAEGRPAAAEADRNKAPAIAALGGFVLHPGRFDGRLGPEHDDRLRVLQCPIDFRREARAALDVAVPPDIVAATADARRQLLGRRGIVARVT